MLIKQNCFIVSETEQLFLESDTYIMPKRGYTGSSLARKQNKNNEFKYNKNKEDIQNANPSNLTPYGQQLLEHIRDEKQIRKELRFNRMLLAKDIDHSLSARSKTKIRSKVIAWANSIPQKQNVKFTFLTLTLTSKQIGSDKDFTKMHNVFFTYLRKYYGFKRYLYVLEKQANGNIHSHILTSQYLPIKQINRIWCKILSDHGYVYNQNGNIVAPIDALINKLRNSDLTSPSPVDISCVYDLKAVTKYVTKYITKNSSAMQTNIWNCSTWVSRLWTGAHICAKTYILDLKRFVVGEKKIMLDNGSYLTVYLLSKYTGIQKNLFSKVNIYET